MGKDLNNRELGKGLGQRKDGRYSARFVNKAGRREQAYFDTLREARNWLVDAKYNDEHNTTRAIEKGVNPKALQKLLGHGSYQVTVDTYVHVTDESKLLAVRQFEGLNS